jgi:16S rRNA (adenine1518-N6/adenine1519-N6)-dimethyltransferase
MTLSPTATRELLEQYQLSPRRAFGQNFVVDPNTVRRIARLSGVCEGDHVLEIGPGVGALTRALVETGATITALEVDRHLIPLLEGTLLPLGVTIREGDAMSANWPELLKGHDRWSLVANLPYNIATPLLCDIVDTVPQITRFLVMVQREVGERITAVPGSKAYGAVSVKMAYWGKTSIAGYVSPNVFLPKPKVESILISFERWPISPLPNTDRSILFRLVRAGFQHRRKMLRQSLKHLVDAEVFATAHIRPEARAEELDLKAWGSLADASRNLGVSEVKQNGDEIN